MATCLKLALLFTVSLRNYICIYRAVGYRTTEERTFVVHFNDDSCLYVHTRRIDRRKVVRFRVHQRANVIISNLIRESSSNENFAAFIGENSYCAAILCYRTTFAARAKTTAKKL